MATSLPTSTLNPKPLAAQDGPPQDGVIKRLELLENKLAKMESSLVVKEIIAERIHVKQDIANLNTTDSITLSSKPYGTIAINSDKLDNTGTKDTRRVIIYSNHDRGFITTYNENAQPVITLSVDKNGGRYVLYNKDGLAQVEDSVSTANSGASKIFGSGGPTSMESFVVGFDKDQHGSLILKNKNGEDIVNLGAATDHSGMLRLQSPDGVNKVDLRVSKVEPLRKTFSEETPKP